MVAWFTEPPGVVIQLTRAQRVGVPLAEWMVGPLTVESRRRFPSERILVLLDTSLMQGRDPPVRAILMDAARRLQHEVSRTILIPPTNAGAVYLASLAVASSLLQVFGVKLDVVRSMPFALSSAGLRVAPRRG
jgi:hypothetical protein